ncbi:SusC/RagA family TonB-linked outer membrane protein [Arcticibacter tournemirensis]|uniref:SusC/RagA family TonB-linked outer membrane protein n=2 Tax=Arcticibacter tournemirensis TaxID=699437 RepID=A0A5M9H804_9SPHI|nr:SusC/RagA family TonB-linked outer membrane protein [Arcticibacter tournemirensis]
MVIRTHLIYFQMKSKILIYILLLACVLSGREAAAQDPDNTVTASGILKESNGRPVEGVTILIQETTTENKSLPDGRFSVEATRKDLVIFKKQGYNTVIKPASALNSAVVIMTPSLIDAGDDDDVAIPFGVRKKRNISASISTVSGSDLPRLPISSLPNTLAGRLPGLYVQQMGSRPGTDDASFLVRGRSSYNSNQAPLILVDGVERDFVNMDVNEVETISVLKDAASISWYGMRGANGVVLVTTKRGSATSTKLTFDAQGGVQMPVYKTRPLDSYSYATLFNQAKINDGAAPQYSEADLAAYQSGSDPYKYPNNNYVDRFLGDAAPIQRYVATVSGGNSFAKYFTLLNVYNQTGLLKGDENSKYKTNANYRKYNFRTNLDLHVTKTLDATIDFGGRVEEIRYPSSGIQTFMSTINTTPPNAFPLLNPDGTYGGSNLFSGNPLAMLNSNGNINDLARTLLATISVRQQLNFLKGLSANALYSYDIQGMYQYGYTQNYARFGYDSNGQLVQIGSDENTPVNYKSSAFTGNVRSNDFWIGLDYDKTLGEHIFNFSTRLQRRVLAVPNALDQKREGISNRLSYSFKSKYFADIVATYSGSQEFEPGRRFGWFPAISAGWIISDEDFFKPATSFIDYLKIRGSYGVVGSDDVNVRASAFYNYYNRSSEGYNFGTSYTNANGSSEGSLANPYLTWERAKKASIGFDAKLFKQSVDVSFDYFDEHRDHLLTSDILPRTIGQSRVQVNEGKAKYSGYETALNFRKSFNKVTLGLNGNFTWVESKVLALNEAANLPAFQSEVGGNIGRVAIFNREGDITYQRLFLISEGLFQSQEEIDAAPQQLFSTVTRPGDIRYKDMNDDRIINSQDMVAQNYSDAPKAYYGFGLSLKYRAFDISAQFQGVYGRTISIINVVNSGSSSNGYLNQFSTQSWTPENASTAVYPRMTLNNRGNNTQQSDFWLRSGDYTRLKVAELGYSLSSTGLKSVHINSMRIYLTGFNLLTFSKLNKLDIDPEIPSSGYNTSYPYVRTFALGVNVKF